MSITKLLAWLLLSLLASAGNGQLKNRTNHPIFIGINFMINIVILVLVVGIFWIIFEAFVNFAFS
jgi:hypothetical protein